MSEPRAMDPVDLRHFDPNNAAFIRDPFPTYRLLRDHAPVHRVDDKDLWVLTRYEHVAAALRDHGRFSSQLTSGLPFLLSLDPPEHTRLRQVASRGFSPRTVAQLGDWIGRSARALLAGVIATPGADLVEAFAATLPIQVIALLLGLPLERRGDLRRWSQALVEVFAAAATLDPAHAAGARRVVDEFVAFLDRLVADRRRRGAAAADDLLGQLLGPTDGGGLSDKEVVWLLLLLVVAGHETTTHLLSGTAHLLLSNPELRALIQRSPERIPSLVEEYIRLESPLQRVLRRAVTDVELDGVTIPAGNLVHLYIGAANRDPRRFPDPDVLDLDRDTRGHLGFGAGVHFCLGASLSRLEGEQALRALLQHLDALTLDPANPPVRRSTPGPHGLVTMPVLVSP